MTTSDDDHLDGFEDALSSIGKARIRLTLSYVRSLLREAPEGDASSGPDGMAVIGLLFTGLTSDGDPTPDSTFEGAAAAMLIFEGMARKGKCSEAEAAASMLSVIAAMPDDLRRKATKIGRVLPIDD